MQVINFRNEEIRENMLEVWLKCDVKYNFKYNIFCLSYYIFFFHVKFLQMPLAKWLNKLLFYWVQIYIRFLFKLEL